MNPSTLRPAATAGVYRWSRRNNHFQIAAADSGLAFGGGGDGFGLHLDAGLERGETAACDTFANPPLLPPPPASAGPSATGEVRRGGSVSFRIVRVEVWGFTLPAPSRRPGGGGARGR
jgi:hypothetical protein